MSVIEIALKRACGSHMLNLIILVRTSPALRKLICLSPAIKLPAKAVARTYDKMSARFVYKRTLTPDPRRLASALLRENTLRYFSTAKSELICG